MISAKLIGWGLKYVLPGLLVVGLLSYGAYQVYDFGRDVERGEWMEVEKVKAEEHAREVEALMFAAEIAAKEHQLKLEEIRNAKQDAIEQLEHDVAVVTARGLYVRTENNCPRTTTGVNPGGASSTSSGARLHEATERNLISLTEEADRVVIQYEGCVNELLEHVDVMELNAYP
jgi:hypothetical protein